MPYVQKKSSLEAGMGGWDKLLAAGLYRVQGLRSKGLAKDMATSDARSSQKPAATIDSYY